MNRETFMHNVKLTDTDILGAFESLMAFYNMYNSIGMDGTVDISKVPNEKGTYDVTYDSEDTATRAYNTCQGVRVKMYSIQYTVSCNQESNKVRISMLS